ncbi:MAG: hypothetical protein GTN76_14240 [Candidatus Aenigmarchaeota archaeon]|nr:hypothetical protein [Candidatus Aenigmarchaeota archaeon]
MFNPFKRKRTNVSSSLILVLIVGAFVGFYGGIILMGNFQEIQPPVFAVSDGENITYFELYDGEKAIVDFLTGENITIGNIDGTNLFIESLGKEVAAITKNDMSDEEVENLVGEAKKRRGRRGREPTCTDSDRGKDYGRTGTVIANNRRERTDYCRPNGKLREFYCRGKYMASVVYDCSKEGKVCVSGACKKIAPSDNCKSPSKKEVYIAWFKDNGVTVYGDGLGSVSDGDVCRIYHMFMILEKKARTRIKPNRIEFSHRYGNSYSESSGGANSELGFRLFGGRIYEDGVVHEFGHFVSYRMFNNGYAKPPPGWTFTSESTDPKDFISGYNDAWTEDFAEVFRFYLLHGPEFRNRVKNRSGSVLEKKYNYMKDRVFRGIEFSCSKIQNC